MGREYVGQLLDRGARRVYAAARDLRTIDITDSRVVPLQLGITRGVSVLDRDTSALRAELETNLFCPLALASAFANQISEQDPSQTSSRRCDPAGSRRGGIRSG